MPESGLHESHIKGFSHTFDVSLDETFRSVSVKLGLGQVSARFFPYAELKHTWRCRCGGLEFKVSDYMDQCTEAELESLAWYLLCKAGGIECPEDRKDAYLKASRSRSLWSNKRDTYLARANALMLKARGTVRDLGEVFGYVNSYYFRGRFEGPILAWSSESPRQRLGYYFEPLNLLAVNRVFDSAKVPRYALEFVMYHELLHSECPSEESHARRVHHTKQFRQREKQFTHYEDAQHWMNRLATVRKGLR